ncbi:DUF1800 domain-containing protein [Pseudomonas sp. MAP12]|uniref:DUF1800 domain-containing protein n=1 Tax=Geopseudomonas aromaticivorans TaxID=2849492 RepID=A0ABS6MVX4_9GAMM|nr:DUF1800 domain-containing protein [Pseudomonas aromaticivorans]MBV2132963.1 DUF1800 domain-containing protein [Pseudomonas aromaticivorans]
MKKKFLHFLHLCMALMGLYALELPAASLDLDLPMNEVQARSMLSRFGYGPTPRSLSMTIGQTPRQYLTRAVGEVSTLPDPVDALADRVAGEPLESIWARYGPGGSAVPRMGNTADRMAMQQTVVNYGLAQIEARLLTMANSDNPGHEALLSFWLNHFSVFVSKGRNRLLVGDYIDSLAQAMREDSFEALLRASFFHPAMQIYLDNEQSLAPESRLGRHAISRGRRVGINENLARELLELHTLGVEGGYDQQDVQELARIITGADVPRADESEAQLARSGVVRRGFFEFDPRRHDFGAKHFLGAEFPPGEGLAEIERALHLMARHPATARHISRKLAQRFLADEPDPEVLASMAAAFVKTDGSISATLFALFESPAFQASLQAPNKFKEPLDYLLSVARVVCEDQPITNSRALFAAASEMGQLPMRRTTPDGYGMLETDWLSPVTMTERIRFARDVARGRVPFTSPEKPAGSGRQQTEGQAECQADPERIQKMLGSTRDATRRSLRGLSTVEKSALLLSSPEFMRR